MSRGRGRCCGLPTSPPSRRPSACRAGPSPEGAATSAAAAGVSAPHSSNENFTPIYYKRLMFFAHFNAGVRAVDVRDPFNLKEIAYYIPAITDKTDKRCVGTGASDAARRSDQQRGGRRPRLHLRRRPRQYGAPQYGADRCRRGRLRIGDLLAAAARPAGEIRRLERRRGPSTFIEGRVGTLRQHSLRPADGTNQLILDDDRQAAADGNNRRGLTPSRGRSRIQPAVDIVEERCATALDEDRAYARSWPSSSPSRRRSATTPSITCESTISPVGPRRRWKMDCAGCWSSKSPRRRRRWPWRCRR